MIRLPDVTLCAVDGVNWQLAKRSLDISRRDCDFAETICFSFEPPGSDAEFRSVHIDGLKSLDEYTPFFLKELNHHIRTPFVLVTQWDSWVIHPEAWSDDFLAYDYIGAQWPRHPHYRVGNGGFSLRSKKLLEALQDKQFSACRTLHGGEDERICREYRSALERNFGIRFAPDFVADRFSYECGPPAPSFGFHGIFNLRREAGEDELKSMASLVPDCVRRNSQWKELFK